MLLLLLLLLLFLLHLFLLLLVFLLLLAFLLPLLLLLILLLQHQQWICVMIKDKYPILLQPCMQPALLSTIGEWCLWIPYSPSVLPEINLSVPSYLHLALTEITTVMYGHNIIRIPDSVTKLCTNFLCMCHPRLKHNELTGKTNSVRKPWQNN